MAAGVPSLPFDPSHLLPPPAPPAGLTFWEILGIALVIILGVAVLVIVVLGGIYILLKMTLKQQQSHPGNDGGGGDVELAAIAELPPAPRHDPHLRPVA